MASDMELVVGVKDLATVALDRLAKKMNDFATSSKTMVSGGSGTLQLQLQRISEQMASGGGNANAGIGKAIENSINMASSKIDAAVGKVNAVIDGANARVQSFTAYMQNALDRVVQFISSAGKIVATSAAFIVVGKHVYNMANSIGMVPNKLEELRAKTVETGQGVMGTIAKFSKYTIAAGATVTLTKATMAATSAQTSLLGRVTAVGRGALAVFVLRNAMKKTEDGASTLTAKIAKVAGTAMAFGIVTKTVVGFGLSLVGLKKKADDGTAALLKTTQAGNGLAAAASKITAAPMAAVQKGASSAAAATANLGSKIEDLPKGAESVNSLVAGFGRFASTIGGIPGLLLSIPAGIAGIAMAAIGLASKTERQMEQLTNKLAIIEAAKLNISIDKIDTAPLRKMADEVELVAKQIQNATNVQSSKLISLATSSLPKGLDPSQMGDAMKAAVGLAEVYGTGIEDGMYRVRQAVEGNFESFEKLIPSLATMTSNAEKMAAVNRLAANGFKVAQKETMTFFGTLEKIKNGFANVLESIGRMKNLSEVLGMALRDVIGPALQFIDQKFGKLGVSTAGWMDSLITGAANVATGVQVIANNIPKVTERVLLTAQYLWEGLDTRVYKFFSDAGTVYAPWMARQVFIAMNTVAQNAAILFESGMRSMIQNSTGFRTMLFALLDEGTATKMVTDAFKPKEDPMKLVKFEFEELPTVAERSLSAAEIAIKTKMDAIDKELGTDFASKFGENLDGIQKMVKDMDLVADINLKTNAPEPKKEDPAANAVTRGVENLQAMQSRFMARGQSNDPQKEMLVVMKRQEALFKKMVDNQASQEQQNRTKSPVDVRWTMVN